jgi:HAD superfamily hydrolase (TIGR01484 family)
MKKLLAFDLDGTLAPSKSTLPERMADLLNTLLADYHVCIISGAKYELFERQVLSQITSDPSLLENLHLMPTSGTRYYIYDPEQSEWSLEYAEDFSDEQKKQIISALEEGLIESGYKADVTYGETVEDRDSQITLSILGQEIVAELGEEGVRLKEEWDPDGSKKMKIREIVAEKIPEFEVRSAGATSIDVTMPGVDKAYGMNRLMHATAFTKADILFFGDRIVEGGNDYSVKLLGIDCVAVERWQDTGFALEGIVKVTQ